MRAHAAGPLRPPDDAYRLTIDVEPDDIDLLNHVNNLVYLRWVQDAATGHWEVLAPEPMKAEVFWVVARHEIDYLRSAVLGDTVAVRTWIGAEADGFFERFTQVDRLRRHPEFGEQFVTLARVRTLWCPMSFATGRRLTDVPEEVQRLFATNSRLG